jgi:hypothetical protein
VEGARVMARVREEVVDSATETRFCWTSAGVEVEVVGVREEAGVSPEPSSTRTEAISHQIE